MPSGKRKTPLMSKKDMPPRCPPPRDDASDPLEKLYEKGIKELQGVKPVGAKYGQSRYGRKSSGYGT